MRLRGRPWPSTQPGISIFNLEAPPPSHNHWLAIILGASTLSSPLPLQNQDSRFNLYVSDIDSDVQKLVLWRIHLTRPNASFNASLTSHNLVSSKPADPQLEIRDATRVTRCFSLSPSPIPSLC